MVEKLKHQKSENRTILKHNKSHQKITAIITSTRVNDDLIINNPAIPTQDGFAVCIDIYLAETNQAALNDFEMNVMMLVYEECHGNVAEVMQNVYQQLRHKFHGFDV